MQPTQAMIGPACHSVVSSLPHTSPTLQDNQQSLLLHCSCEAPESKQCCPAQSLSNIVTTWSKLAAAMTQLQLHTMGAVVRQGSSGHHSKSAQQSKYCLTAIMWFHNESPVIALPAVAALPAGKSPPGELDHATSGAVVHFLQTSASTVCIKAWARDLQAAKLWLPVLCVAQGQ